MMRLALLLIAVFHSVSVLAQELEFDRSLLKGTWAESVSTAPACSKDNVHSRFEISQDGGTLHIRLDRKWKLANGKEVDSYTANIIRSTPNTLVINYNPDAGAPSPNYEYWEMAFVAPGVYRWRLTQWQKGAVNTVVGIRCAS